MNTAKTLDLRMVSTREQLAPFAAVGVGDCLRPFANEHLNSRLPHSLARGEWKVRWRAPLPASEPFLSILQASGQTLITGRTQWFLFDREGRQMANQPTAGEDAEIETKQSIFYASNRYSNVSAYHLANGSAEYRFQVEGTADYARSFVHRQGASLIVASFLRALNPLSQAPVKVSALEIYEFLQPVKMDEDQLTSVEQKAIRHYETPRLWTAVHGSIIVTAYTNKIEFLDLSLQTRRTLAGEFEPQGMSLDESGRMHLLVQAGSSQALWLVAHQGDTVPVRLGHAAYQRPPVVGYDHTVYVLGLNAVTAVSQDGKLAWQYAPKGRVAGATALPPNMLLLAAGSEILALNDKGEAMPVHEFSGESLTTSPVLVGPRELLASTQNYLYCLGQGAL